MTPAGSSFDSAGVPIRYVERGAGSPIVLVHSYMSSFERQFDTGFVDALAAEHRVIGIDLRGHGGSGKPHDPSCYGREMTIDLVRLLDHLAIAKAHVLGYSLGAHLVAQLLTLHPDRLLTAILGGSCGRRRWSADDDRRVEVEARELERRLLTTQLERLRRPGARPLTDVDVRAVSARLLNGNDPLALAAIRRSNRDQVVDDAHLAATDVPTLGIVGSNDPYLASFVALARAMPQLRVCVIDGESHNEAARRPEFLRAVREFLIEHSAAPSPHP